MCAAGGDRILRHNAVHDFVFQLARAAGLHPDLGRFLPDEPNHGQARRRPAAGSRVLAHLFVGISCCT